MADVTDACHDDIPNVFYCIAFQWSFVCTWRVKPSGTAVLDSVPQALLWLQFVVPYSICVLEYSFVSGLEI